MYWILKDNIIERLLLDRKIFERLPQCIKQSKSKQFKSKLIEYLNERCFYNFNDFLNDP